MIAANELFILRVRAILIYLRVISKDTGISNKDWLLLKEDGLSPIQAVRADLDCKLPFISWQSISEITKELTPLT